MKAVIKSTKWIKEYESKFGILHVHLVEFDDKKAYYNSKTKEQNKFVAGQECEFDVEEKEGKTGKYLTVKPIKQQQWGNSQYGKAVKKEQSKYSGFALSYAKDLVVADKLAFADMLPSAEKMFKFMVSLDKSID